MKYLDEEEKILVKQSEKDAKKIKNQIQNGTFEEDLNFKNKLKLAANQEKKSESISLRLEPSKLQSLKEIAQQEGLPYQTLINSVLHKFIMERKTQNQKPHSKYSQ